jgi:hypothetical protein
MAHLGHIRALAAWSAAAADADDLRWSSPPWRRGEPAGAVATYGGRMVDRLTVRLRARGLAERRSGHRMREALDLEW